VRADDAERSVGDGLVAVRSSGLAALATPHEGAPAPVESELRVHDRITEWIHANTPSLPSRFGQIFESEAELAAALAEQSAALARTLDEVGARIELDIHLAWRDASQHAQPGDASTGRGFLEAAAARERGRREAEGIAARLVAHLEVDQALTRCRICPREGVAAIVAVLTERNRAAGLVDEVAAFGRTSEDVTATVYGPLPPYSFAT
jgi:hypothetical protein